jgi:elongation factor P--beta-lysine ligase
LYLRRHQLQLLKDFELRYLNGVDLGNLMIGIVRNLSFYACLLVLEQQDDLGEQDRQDAYQKGIELERVWVEMQDARLVPDRVRGGEDQVQNDERPRSSARVPIQQRVCLHPTLQRP